MKLQVRFGGLRQTVTTHASALVMAALGIRERTTEAGVKITSTHYEGDWDAEIDSEQSELAASWVCSVWPDSRITE